jgi:hypothetical protein
MPVACHITRGGRTFQYVRRAPDDDADSSMRGGRMPGTLRRPARHCAVSFKLRLNGARLCYRSRLRQKEKLTNRRSAPPDVLIPQPP